MAALSIVRPQVRRLLEASPAYAALPPERRRQIAHDTVRVAAYMADPGGLISRGFGSTAANPSTRRAALTVDLAHTLRGGSTAFDELIDAVDFPSFVAELIHGVFNAIVEASIRQMEAYAALLAGLAASVDRFVEDTIDDRAARDTLASEFPDLFACATSAKRALAWRADADPGARRRLQAALGLANPEPDLRRLVALTRRRRARNRQQLLATTVLMGINRIVVTDGRITPKIRFELARP